MAALNWRSNLDGRPPDDDERTYRWDRQRRCWVALDMPEIDEDALEEWEHRRRERIAEANEY